MESLHSRLAPGKSGPEAPRLQRPRAPKPKWANIPAELRSRPQWIGWAYDLADGRWTKIPRRADRPVAKASSTDPTTWTTAELARAAYEAGEALDGIGYVFTPDDPFVGIDFDNCLGPDGEVLEWARAHLDALAAAYLEISPSGRGLKGWIRGKLPGDGKGRKKTGLGPDANGAIELYERGRFFTVTGDAWADDYDLSADLSGPLESLYEEVATRRKSNSSREELRTPTVPIADDEDLIERIRSSSNGAKFSRLFDSGDASAYAEDESAADIALMNMLAFWTAKDPGRMERMFSRSALGQRSKWADRPDYRARTIEEAIAYVGDTYSPHRNGKPATAPTPLEPTAERASQPKFNLTDLGNAERLIHRHGINLRFCHPWKKWLTFDGKRWAIDNTAAARRWAKDTARSIYREAATEPDEVRRKSLAAHAHDTEKRDRLAAMMTVAEMENPILPDEMDRDPWSFNCLNGTIDLRTGELKKHRREDYITKLCKVTFDPSAECPTWMDTLHLFFGGDEDLIGYFQRICGYAICGEIRDHLLPICYGDGSNGKSTMLGALLDTFGPDYGMKATGDLLASKHQPTHSTDKTDLFGKRLVVGIETEDGRGLNETLVKELTGGDRIRARRMREDNWEFEPTHTFLLATNHKPDVKGDDHGIWRRIRLIPFGVQVDDAHADKAVPSKLREERAGILAWCVEGCLAWQRQGLDEPEIVTRATSDYRKEQDALGRFLEEFTIQTPRAKVKAGALYDRYKQWADATNERKVLTMKTFGTALAKRGVEKLRSGGIWYEGIGLRAEEVADDTRDF